MLFKANVSTATATLFRCRYDTTGDVERLLALAMVVDNYDTGVIMLKGA